MPQLLREIRDVKRFNQILIVLVEEGFGYFVNKLKVKHKFPLAIKLLPKKLKKSSDEKPEVKLRRTLERLGPTFIKFGQVLSMRPDLIPSSYAKELEKLLDAVPKMPFSQVKAVVEKELGKPLSSAFKEFRREPIASASISQVHAAVLKSGEKAAVKVQRPDIKKIMETDIDIMFYIAELLEKHSQKLRDFQPVNIVKEFREWTEKELDFHLEARNAKRFYSNFKYSKTVKIPKVYDGLTTEKILVFEYMEGVELNKYKEIEKKGINFKQVLENGFDAILTMVFEHGLFHADPHPGNIIVTPDGKLAFVDFGIVGYFDEKLKNKSIDLLYGITESDADTIINTLLSLGLDTHNVNMDEFREDVINALDDLKFSSIKEVKLSSVLEELISIPLRHKFRIPPQFVLLGKTIVTLEGVALEYDPDFKIIDSTKPFLEKLVAKRSSPAYIFRSFVHNTNRYRRFLEDFPDKAEVALDKVGKGSIKLEVKDTDIRNLATELDKSSNRITYGLIIAALLMTSALTLQVQKGPFIFSIPILSFISFFVATILGIILFFSIIKEKHAYFREGGL